MDIKILLVDADEEANASSGMGIDIEEIVSGTYEVLEHQISAKEAIIKTNTPNLDIIPAHVDLVAAEIEIVDQDNREYLLKEALSEIKDEYDYIIIDRKSTRLNSSHVAISYAVFCSKKKEHSKHATHTTK